MKTKLTLNDLLQYHYGELPSTQNKALAHQLEMDSDFRQESNKIAQMKNLLETEAKSPHHSSIRIIMDYNRQNSSELEAC